MNFNFAWRKSPIIPNPNPLIYDGVYESYTMSGEQYSRKESTMYIYINGYTSFKLYIRSYAGSSCYVMVSELDQPMTENSSVSDTTIVKAHTQNNHQQGTSIDDYTLVEFDNIDRGNHVITIIYCKMPYASTVNDDRGYVLIPKGLGSSDSGGGSGGGDIIIDTNNYMTIYALEDGLQAKLSGNTVSYSIDEGTTWTELASNTYTPTVNSGQTIMFKGNLTPTSSSGIGRFTINKKCNLEGNCMSLLFGDNAANNYSLSGKNYAFYSLFSGCITIIQVSETFLPATTLADFCYSNMFNGCSSLVNAPELPATTLVDSCYSYMFSGTNVLPDCSNIDFTSNTVISSGGLRGLFAGTKVTDADLFNILPINPSTGKYWLSATTLTNSCYYQMFTSCGSLTTAPELPATSLASYCYYQMFNGCSKLNYIKMLATDISATSCLYNWVNGVSSSGTFVKNPAMTSLPTGTSGIPNGWTVVDNG